MGFAQKVEIHPPSTLKELRWRLLSQNRATLSGLRTISSALLNPGFQSKPWADISQRFQRYSSF